MLNLADAPAKVIAHRFAPNPNLESSPEPKRPSLNARIAALRTNKRGEKVMLSLSEAATAAGIAKSTVWRAVKAGKISAARTITGQYEIDPAELFRAFPATPKNVETKQPAPAVETGLVPALETQINALKEVSGLLKEQLEDIRNDRDAWRTQAESNQRLLMDARPRRRGLLGWRKG